MRKHEMIDAVLGSSSWRVKGSPKGWLAWGLNEVPQAPPAIRTAGLLRQRLHARQGPSKHHRAASHVRARRQ